MWIRSQDKSFLGKCNRIIVVKNRILNFVTYSPTGCDDCDVLGEYETYERVIEVLNQIQHFIELTQDKNIVYEMPKE